MAHSDRAEADEPAHVAQFYEADAVLLNAVSEFVGAALRAGDAAIVVATSAHREELEARLRADGLDVAPARARGRYVTMDAAETLATFTVDGAPDPGRFAEVIGGIIARAAEAGRRVRIFGEMVAVLAAAGQHTAALHLEELWNDLRRTHPFSLFCAYPLDALGGEGGAGLLGDICAEHARVIPAESYTALADPDDRLRAIVVLQQKAAALEAEIAERRRVEERLLHSERELRDFVENATEGLHWVGADGRILWANQAELDLLGYARDEYVGRHIAEFHADPPVIEDILGRLAAREELHGYMARLRCKDGSIKHVLISSNVLWEDGKFVHTRCFTRDVTERVRAAAEIRQLNAELEQRVRDRTAQLEAANRTLAEEITERKRIEAELVHHAFHDALTGLPNRALFMDRLAQALAGARRRGHAVAVLFLDLDRFKVVNDSLGHGAGDALLIKVAERLQASVREEDTVARLGGDEFGLVLTDPSSPSTATDAAERILSAMGQPFSIEGGEVFATASIGIALRSVSERASAPGDLLREADIAMYRAKRMGGAQAVHFGVELHTDTRERLGLETDLRHAIERGELRVHYQPIVRLSTGRVTGLEALARWAHPRRGMVAPGEFIPLAEETGLIVPIGTWVLREACRQAHAWQAEHASDPPLTMSVNLAARQLQCPALIEDVTRILRETGLDPSSLKLEITESATMQDPAATVESLRRLKALGIRLAIDDFGTGYSSLAYLRRFPIDVLKIDRSFVEGMGQDQESTAIVRTIVALAAALDLTVTAEGVETAEQLAELRALGCDRAQGYYFARPLPQHDIGALLRGRRPPNGGPAGDNHDWAAAGPGCASGGLVAPEATEAPSDRDRLELLLTRHHPGTSL